VRRTGPSECLAHLRDRKHLIATALEAGVERRAENLLPNGATRCRTAMKGRWIGDFQHDGVAGWKAGRDLH
jgi:hypothetical protein